MQIKGQMGVCKMKWCDFVSYTTKDIYVESIYFDDDVYKEIVNKSMKFLATLSNNNGMKQVHQEKHLVLDILHQ
jgi:hypothetical protein